MSDFQNIQRKFSNHRQWRDFVTAVHESVTYPCAVTYPRVIGALRSGRDLFSDGAARASSWLSNSTSFPAALTLEQAEAREA
jgi:hypothetical protein